MSTDRRICRATPARPDGLRGGGLDAAPRLLVAGGDAVTRLMVRFLLSDLGYVAAELAQPRERVTSVRVADLLVVADSVSGDGVEMVASLHLAGYRGPTVLLTRGKDPSIRRRAAALGVLEVIGLPAAPGEVQARLLARLDQPRRPGRPSQGGAGVVCAGGLTLRTATRDVSNGTGWVVTLTRLEAALLRALMCNAGRPLTCEALLEQVWGDDDRGSDNAVRVRVRRLRDKLTDPADHRGYISTVRGQGYVFNACQPAPSALPVAARDVPPAVAVSGEKEHLARTQGMLSKRAKCS